MSEPLLSPRFLFRLAVPCRYRDPLWGPRGAALGDEFRLPNFEELDGRAAFADVRAAWSEQGLALAVRVEGKRGATLCDDERLAESDGVQVWIDTRDTHNVHRASRFCQRFVFLPFGAGRKSDEPIADPLLINRAKEHARPVQPGELRVQSEQRIDGYVLEAFISAKALTGFDPAEYPRLGFNYLVLDKELGEQTFAAGGEFPFEEDPSVWGTLELVR